MTLALPYHLAPGHFCEAGMHPESVRCDVLQSSDVEQMVRLLAAVFSAGDPPAVAIGLSFAGFLQMLGTQAVAQGLTVVARNAGSDELMGVLLTDDFAVPPPLDPRQISKKALPVFSMLDALDDQYRHGKAIAQGEYLHLFMLGVAHRFTGQGIAQRLVETCLENGKRKGYRWALTEATGVVSQRVFRNLGFVERFRVSYRDYRYNGDAVFASIQGHDGAALMDRSLA